jgi:GntR family transcriptional regulator, regulator for abcA and norABC
MDIYINHNEMKNPLYKQIVQQIEEQILNGSLEPGYILPTERQLALRIGVNRTTVTSAYNELRKSGMIYSKQGSGTIVSDDLQQIPSKVVQWRNFTNEYYTPLLPIIKRIFEASKQAGVINLSVDTIPYQIPEKQNQKIMNNIINDYQGIFTDILMSKARDVLSNHLTNQWKIPTKPDEVILTSGLEQSLILLVYSLLNRGDVVVIDDPSLTYSVKFFNSFGIKMVKMPSSIEGINPNVIRDLYQKHRIRMVITTPTFHEVTGDILPLVSRLELISVCKELKIPIIELGSTIPLAHNPSVSLPPSLYELDYSKEIVIHIGDFHDSFGAGVEFGWILGGYSVFEVIRNAKYQLGYRTSRFPMLYMIEYLNLNYWEEHIMNYQIDLNHRKNILLQAVETYLAKKATYTIPSGGRNLWVKVNIPYHSDLELIEACIKSGVIVFLGTVFGGEKGTIMISYAKCREDQIEEGVKRLSLALQNIKKY